jgi:O-methyltransferase
MGEGMNKSPEELYLDLLKKTISFTLWPEPPVPIDNFIGAKPFLIKLTLSFISRIFKFGGFQIVKPIAHTNIQREEGRVTTRLADSMIGLKRLDNIQYCVETIIKEGIEGDLIETGVWRGGACILMRAILAVHGITNRKVFLADSFEGLPIPDDKKYPADKGNRHYTEKFFAVSQKEVELNFNKYGLLDDQVVFLKGWFKDTLPSAPIDKLAVLRLDGDLYASTIEALTHLYPKLSIGGFCIIDDYGALTSCKKAVDDFRQANGIGPDMKVVDWTGRYWRKE